MAGARWVAQFAQRLGLNLANALTGDGEDLANFFESALVAVLKTKAHADDAFFAGTELLQHEGHRLLQAEADGRIRWRSHGLVFDEIAQVSVFLFADRSLEGNRRLRDLASPAHFFDAHVHPLGQLLRSGLAAKLLHKSAEAPSELVDDLDHVNGNTDGARLVGDGACDGLANPPGGVRGELVAAAPVELVGAFHEPEIAFLDQVEKLQAMMGVFLGDGDDQAKVGFGQFFFCLLRLCLTPLDERERVFEAGQSNFALQKGANRTSG
jgi:hypothetical protein